MRRRSRPPQHPILPFPSDSNDPPVALEELPDTLAGGQHAVQDNHHRTSATATKAARQTPPEAPASRRRESIRPRAEDSPRGVENESVQAAAGHRSEPDRERGDG